MGSFRRAVVLALATFFLAGAGAGAGAAGAAASTSTEADAQPTVLCLMCWT